MAEDITNKAAAACCSKRAAEGKRVPGWLDSALLLQLEEKLLDMFDGKPGFGGGVLLDYDVTFCADINLSPVVWVDGVCGFHAFTILVCVRGGKVASYTVQGCEPRQVFCRILPQGQDVKNS